jgi:hypothetical protein
MTLISPQEADKFASYSTRLTEIDIQLDQLHKKNALTDTEKEFMKNLTTERDQIVNWFNKTSK